MRACCSIQERLHGGEIRPYLLFTDCVLVPEQCAIITWLCKCLRNDAYKMQKVKLHNY